MADVKPLVCDDETRRSLVLGSPRNGIDYIEISVASHADQRFIHVHFLKPLPQPAAADPGADPSRYRIEGGIRIRDIEVVGVTLSPGGDHVVVEVDEGGDFSTYTLVIEGNALDPAYSRCDFSFKAGCPSRFDCRPRLVCAPEQLCEIPVDYMVKDFASFRQGLLDLIPTVAPEWQERHDADLGMALVDLLAYAGDQLSYYQDAVANEAFLETARQRVSVRRHARLIDYGMHEGASARTFVHFRVDPTIPVPVPVPSGARVLTRILSPVDDQAPPHPPLLPQLQAGAALEAAEAVFETMEPVTAYRELNEIEIHAWLNRECCVPRGATSVDLVDDLTAYLKAGDYLLFEEVRGPVAGLEADADPEHRQVVRLEKVEGPVEDPLPLTPGGATPQSLTRVTWGVEDALTFPPCLSAKLTSGAREGQFQSRISVARGNLALADHGRTIDEVRVSPGVTRGERHPGPERLKHPSLHRSHRIRLRNRPLSYRIPINGAGGSPAPVQTLMATDPQAAEPQVVRTVVETQAGDAHEWTVVPNLLASQSFDRHLMAEAENDGTPLLRFGDNEYGMAPPIDSTIYVTYRVGAGASGNVGREALAHLIDDGTLGAIEAVRNPLPAWGGVGPEPLERVKRLAPPAFHADPIRAVTEADYAAASEKHPEVAKAVATFRWTGSWYMVFITVDRRGGTRVDSTFEDELRDFIQRSRLVGYDLEIDGPIFVPLEIEIDVCVHPGHFQGHVEEALVKALSSRTYPDGSNGFFHPDNFTFGQPVYVSRLYAAIEAVEGVDSAEVRVFKRFYQVAIDEIEEGRIPIERLEVACLDNDPSFPENGVLRLNMRGGK